MGPFRFLRVCKGSPFEGPILRGTMYPPLDSTPGPPGCAEFREKVLATLTSMGGSMAVSSPSSSALA